MADIKSQEVPNSSDPIDEAKSKSIRDQVKEDLNDLVFSYVTLRNLIGFSGILLPIVLVIFSRREEHEKVIQGSISAYYYTSVGDIFVIVVCILSAFLLTYKGYRTLEKVLLSIASVSGFGLTMFPTAWKEGMLARSAHVPRNVVPKIFQLEIHWVFAGLFFISLSLISIFFFTKTRQKNVITRGTDQHLTQKSWRNIVYITMGCIMLVCMTVILIYSVVDPVQKFFGDFSLIFCMETVAVFAFGVSWITKGETLFPDKDKPHYIIRGIRMLFHTEK